MAKYLIEGTTLTSVANSIRIMTGISDTMTASEMANNLRDVKADIDNEIATQTDLIAQIKAALEAKGGTT